MGNTSTKSADEVRAEIARVLEELASYSLIHSIVNTRRYFYISIKNFHYTTTSSLQFGS